MHVRSTTLHCHFTVLLISVTLQRLVSRFDFNNIVFVIISQRDPHNAAIATQLKRDIEKQTLHLNKGQAKIHLTHEDFPAPGDWTIFPLLRPLVTKYKSKDVRWVVFLEPVTAVRCSKLIEVMAAADQDSTTKWMGYPLQDENLNVVHDLKYYKDLIYPNFGSGFAMRLPLMDTLIDQIATGQRLLILGAAIDPAFEFAKLIYGHSKDPGPLLTEDFHFCVEHIGDNCATYQKKIETCGSPIAERSIFFAVKTWQGYHNTRVKIVKKTWGRRITNIMFYSDKADPSLPSVETGVLNSKKKGGACKKTRAIFKMAVNRVRNMTHIKWIFLADDDTIVGIHRLTEFLSCYKGGSEIVALGERFGFGYDRKVTLDSEYAFLNYITFGGGAVFSVAAAAALARCTCPVHDAADDVYLAECANSYNYTMIHSPLFHQFQPMDYPRMKLTIDKPVSFHRPLIVSPLRVYRDWFQHDDESLRLRLRRKKR